MGYRQLQSAIKCKSCWGYTQLHLLLRLIKQRKGKVSSLLNENSSSVQDGT